MSLYLDTTGKSTLGIALCARCSRKFPLGELSPDPNFPGLMVCVDDRDQFDPYRLAPRAEDRINLPFVRPDANIDTRPAGVIQEDGNAFFLTEDGLGYLEI